LINSSRSLARSILVFLALAIENCTASGGGGGIGAGGGGKGGGGEGDGGGGGGDAGGSGGGVAGGALLRSTWPKVTRPMVRPTENSRMHAATRRAN